MARKSLEQMIAQEMGRDAFRLFTTDEEFKSAKSFEDFCKLLQKRSSGKVETTPPTVQRMVMGWIASNKCKVADFEDVLKAAKETKGHKGKISFRETLEKHFNTNIWDYFRTKLKACDSISSALSVIMHESNNKVKTSEATFCRTIESGLEAGEFPIDSDWVKWLPKKRHRKTAEEKAAEEKASHDHDSIMGRGECKKCGWVGPKAVSVFSKHCTLGLRGMRCPSCSRWATLLVEITVFGKKVKITNTIDEQGVIGEDFVNDNWEPIPNPFFPEPSKEELKRIKSRKATG